MDDGTEIIAEPGEITSLPEGNDASMLPDDPLVLAGWSRSPTTAYPATPRAATRGVLDADSSA
jgi:hypothetical protein